MDGPCYIEFGWNDGVRPSYHKFLCKHIEKMLPGDGSPVLDLGCGNGCFANYLNKKGYCVYGTDASVQGIKIANGFNTKNKEPRFYVHDITTGKLPPQLQNIPFKTVISMEVIEHIYDPIAYIRFVKNILEQNGGGTFIISTPYHGYLKNILLAVSGRMDRHWSALWVGGHIKFWSKRTLGILLSQAGFRNLEFTGVGRAPYLWRHMVYRAESGNKQPIFP